MAIQMRIVVRLSRHFFQVGFLNSDINVSLRLQGGVNALKLSRHILSIAAIRTRKTTTQSHRHQRMPQLRRVQSVEYASIRMPRHWLMIVRGILHDLKRANNAKLQNRQLEQLHVAIHQTNKLSGLENICAIGDFLRDDRRRKQTHCMVALFNLRMSAQFCSEYVASLLIDWITENLPQQIDKSIRIERSAFSLS